MGSSKLLEMTSSYSVLPEGNLKSSKMNCPSETKLKTNTQEPIKNSLIEQQESETEDEEVKMNCIGGARGMQESDFNTTDSSEGCETDSIEEASSKENPSTESGEGVVNFVNEHMEQPATPLHRPKPVLLSRPMMELSLNCDAESGSVSSTKSSKSQESAVLEAPPSLTLTSDDDIKQPQECSPSSSEDLAPNPLLQTLSNQLSPDELDNSFVELLQSPVRSERKPLVGTIKFEDSNEAERKAKRVLSQNHIASLDNSSWSPKRLRSAAGTDDDSLRIPIMNLGQLATNDLAVEARSILRNNQSMSPVTSSEEDFDAELVALDKRLIEELNQQSGESSSREENPPVPLLTPPQSPLTIQVDEGTTATVCEWPSNLAVDSALTAAIGLRPMSPNSLQQFEQDEDQRISNQVMGTTATSLTPIFQGIYVGFS